MKIAILHSRYSARVPSGENMVVDAEVAALARRGIDVRLFQTDPNTVRAGRLYPARAGLRATTGRGRSFSEEIHDFRPDLVHVHNVFPDLGERSVASLPYPLVATAHNYRWGCVAGTFFREGETCTKCVSGSPLAGVVHGCHHGRLGSLPLAIAHVGGISRNPIVRKAREIWSPSELHRRRLTEFGLPVRKTKVSPHFLPDWLSPSPIDGKRENMVFVGRLEAAKGVLNLVRQWPKCGPGLDIVGDGTLRAKIVEAARGKPIRLRGQQKREVVLGILASARGLVFSSEWWEPFGLVAIEALAAGTPILTWGDHAVSELTLRHEAGVVLSEPEHLGDGLARIADRSPDDWARRNRTAFLDNYSETVWQARRESEYRNVIDGS